MVRVGCEYSRARLARLNGHVTDHLHRQAVFLVHLLTLLCCLNALYTFLRKRDYRLFERPLDDQPATPSARRVHVDHSPIALSPLRYLHKLASPSSAAQVHGDAARQVWELRVWNPKPFHLTLFTLFSPGHLLLYYTLLPPAPMDPRPSVTMLTAIAFSLLLSVQLGLLRTSFAQQAKDSTLVHGEVMHEYDTKFVRPSLNRPVRDVATQTPPTTATPHASHVRPVDLYTPTTIINRGFRTHPNPTYAPRAEPASPSRRTSGIPARPAAVVAVVPTFAPRPPATAAVTELSSPLKPHHERLRERSPAKGDGGSMGVYTHAASPLRRAASSGRLAARPEGGVAGRAGAGLGRERERERPGRY